MACARISCIRLLRCYAGLARSPPDPSNGARERLLTHTWAGRASRRPRRGWLGAGLVPSHSVRGAGFAGALVQVDGLVQAAGLLQQLCPTCRLAPWSRASLAKPCSHSMASSGRRRPKGVRLPAIGGRRGRPWRGPGTSRSPRSGGQRPRAAGPPIPARRGRRRRRCAGTCRRRLTGPSTPARRPRPACTPRRNKATPGRVDYQKRTNDPSR